MSTPRGEIKIAPELSSTMGDQIVGTPRPPPPPQRPSIRKRCLGRALRCCGSHTGACASFICFTFVFVPALLFGVSLFMAIIMWRVECDEDPEVPGACSYYNWFLYLLGNLVGLGTPLTDISPSSGSYSAEIIDLLISTWSLSIAGTLYGVIGGLYMIETARSYTDRTFINARFFAIAENQIEDLTNDASGMDIDEFRKVAVEALPNLDDDALVEAFHEADKSGNGTLDHEEGQALLKHLHQQSDPMRRMVSSHPRTEPASPRRAATVWGATASLRAFRCADRLLRVTMASQGQMDKDIKDMKHNIQLIQQKLDTLLSRQQGVI